MEVKMKVDMDVVKRCEFCSDCSDCDIVIEQGKMIACPRCGCPSRATEDGIALCCWECSEELVVHSYLSW